MHAGEHAEERGSGLVFSYAASFEEVWAALPEMLKELGIRLSLDDFGTGYSSLSYLRHFPIDRLKIDRSFVTDITTDTSAAAIVDTILSLARNLDLAVIAEGVETAEQLALLTQRGCGEAQGYLLGYPCPADEFIARFLPQ